MIDAMDVKVIQKVREYLSTQPVLKAWVFGSFSRGEQTPTSDVDIIVVFDEKAEVSLIGYVRIQYELENIFGRKVDLVEDGSLLPFAVESANRDRKLIYVILSTHIVSDIDRIADRILMMNNGKLIFDGTREEIKGDLEEFYLSEFGEGEVE